MGEQDAGSSREKPFPFEPIRHWYVTPFGGRSEELSPGQVGINAEALNQNTDLVPDQDRVLISVLGRSVLKPLYTRTTFQVVALDSRTPYGLQKSPHGEAVLPVEEPWEIVKRPYLRPKHGEPLVLNSVAFKVFGKDPRELLSKLLQQDFEKRFRGPFH
ncbi:MAG: hypothetical protein ACE5HJ_03330 [Thermoplasmata archaeon]